MGTDGGPGRRGRRRLLDLLSLLLVAAIFGLVLPRIASYRGRGRLADVRG
jgi:hypothetical protein